MGSCHSSQSLVPISFACLQITFVDFLAYDLLDRLRMFEPKCLDAFPNLKDFIARFEVIPLILLLFTSLVFPFLLDAFLVLEPK